MLILEPGQASLSLPMDSLMPKILYYSLTNYVSCSYYRIKHILDNLMTKSLLIGELSIRTGVNIETIRFYEKQNILPAPARSDTGRRLYDEEDVKRLHFIHRCRGLGFSLKEILSLLSLVDGGNYTCKQVHDLTVLHVTDVEEKILALQKMETVLNEMIEHCSKGDVPECPIIDSLFAN